MRASLLSATLAVSVGVSSALPQTLDLPKGPLAPALPLKLFETKKFTVPLTLADILAGIFKKPEDTSPAPLGSLGSLFGKPAAPAEEESFRTASTAGDADEVSTASVADDANDVSIAATCSNPRVRIEWDSYSDSDRQAYISAIRCLQNKGPSGQFAQSKSRYEDIVSLHQNLTPNVHGNAKFLLWHRYYLWTFEDVLRSECGFDRALPWFDETRYAGRFSDSSIFSSQWYGSVNVGGNCVTDGQFANLAINVGPGSDNYLHCLARNGDGTKTQYTSSAIVDGCNNEGEYANMASCSEGGAHAWGHNGVGAVMQDTYGAPADPFFFLHHAFIDRNFRIWQNRDSSRLTNVNGRDASGNPLTLDTTVSVSDVRPTVQIRDILDTVSDKLCYKYNY